MLLPPPPATLPPHLHASPAQLRIGTVFRRDEEEGHPMFPGAPAHPVSRLAAVVVGLAAGPGSGGGLVRVTDETMQGAAA